MSTEAVKKNIIFDDLNNIREHEQLNADSELVDRYKALLIGQTTLNLSNKEMGDVETIALAEALKEKKVTAHTINLSNNKIGPIGSVALAKSLKVNETVRNLNLSQNPIGDLGGSALSETLLDNTTLESLTLTGCKIRDGGAAAIALSLMANKTLHSLDLLYNEIGEVGGSSLATAMKTNGALTTFTQFGNKINDKDRGIISDELKRNRSLGIQKNVLMENKTGIEKNDSWKITQQCISKEDKCWTLINLEKHPGKLREIVFNLHYQKTSQQEYDGFGKWCTVTLCGNEPRIKFSFYDSQHPSWENDLIKSLTQSNIIVDKGNLSDFIVRSPNFFSLEKLLIFFVTQGYLTKEKAAEFLKACSEK